VKMRWIAAGAALAIGGTAAAAYALNRDTATPDRGSVIARVNGYPLYSAYAQIRLNDLTSGHAEFDVDLADKWKPEVLKSMVADVIVSQEAERRGIEVTESDLAAEVAKVRSMSGPADKFDDWLESQGMTLTELERRVENKLRWDKVSTAVIGEVTVSDAEISAYYDDHSEDFTDSEGVRPLFEVKPSIEEMLVTGKENAKLDAWLAAQRDKAEVEILDDTWAAAK